MQKSACLRAIFFRRRLGIEDHMSSARVFLNEGSGAACDAEEVARLFHSHGWSCECTRLRAGVDVRSIARNDPAGVVFVAAGGDGTINAVAAAIAGSQRALGVLPVGTLNHFAHDLGLPMKLEDAVAVIASGARRQVDAGEVNGQLFVNNSSIGMYPTMVLDRERMKKGGLNKWASLLWASAKAFVRYPCFEVELEVDGRVVHCRTPLVFVGNTA
jgi:diacylglycerol kinase family enzyme